MTTVEASLAQPAERVIARLRPHARILFWPSIVLIACCGAVGYWGGNLPEFWQNLAVFCAAALIVLLLFLLPLALWLSTRYTITTRRMILRSGFFVRVRREVMHSRGYDVTVKKNWLQAAFGSGDIRIESGVDQPVVLKDVPKANLVQGALHDLMENSQNLLNARRAQEQAQQQSALPDQTGVFGRR